MYKNFITHLFTQFKIHKYSGNTNEERKINQNKKLPGEEGASFPSDTAQCDSRETQETLQIKNKIILK